MTLDKLSQITEVGIQSGITLRDINVIGVVTATTLSVTEGFNVTGVVTATSFSGNVTGNITPSGLVVSGVSTFQASSFFRDINVIGVVTATSFSGNVTGNITPSGLVVSGVSTFQASSFFRDINVIGVVTATTLSVTEGFNVTGVVTATSFSGNVTGNITPSGLVVSGVSTFQASSFWGDGDVAYFGDGNDLLIFHNSTDSIIRDNGTGDLCIEGGNVIRMTSPTGIETYANFNQDSSVELYYDGNKKFETTSGGVTAYGNVHIGTETTIDSGIGTISRALTGASATNRIPVLTISSNVSNPVYNTFDDYKKRSGVHIDVGYATTEFDSKILIPDWRNNNLVLEKSSGNYEPGTIIRGRLPDLNYNSGIGTLYNNGYSDIFPNSSAGLGTVTARISAQTAGYNPADDYLKHGIINDNTIITGSEYYPHQAREFGAGGTGRIGFCYITYGGDMVARLHQEAGSYGIYGVNVAAYADPGSPVQAILSGPINSGATVYYTQEDYRNIGVSTDNTGTAYANQKDANRNTLGKIVKVVGNIESKSSTSGFFCLTEKGYVWATTEHNTYGWLNQGNTTNVQECVIVWDINDYDHQDRYSTDGIATKKVANITSTMDFSCDPDNTGGIVYCKVVQETDRYHEMWHTGGYQAASGQLADGTLTNRNFSKACLFNIVDDPATAGVTYTGTYVQSNNGINVGVAGTNIRITFASDPGFYLGEFIRIDFTSGTAVDDSYEVTDYFGGGVYTVQRHTGKNARATTSLTTSGNFNVLGRSQLLRKLGRTILGQWSGGGNWGSCFIQDNTYTIWAVGENSSGHQGDGTTADKLYFKNISTGSSLPVEQIYKMVIHGSDAAINASFILFKNWTLWHSGRNTSGYGYGNTTTVTTWSQIAGPGCSLTNPPTGNVYNFWIRPKAPGGVVVLDSLLLVDYTEADGWCFWAVGENGSRQLMNGTTTDSTSWVVPTQFPQNYGTAASPIRTKTGWIPEQIWTTSQAGSSGHGYIALFRNLTTNEYRCYGWGYNVSGLLGNGLATAPTNPERLIFDIPSYKIKDISVFARDTNYDGIGVMISYDGELYGIGGARYASGTPTTYPDGAFWNPSNGTASGNISSRIWRKVNPLGPY